jgi:hypothetical protein
MRAKAPRVSGASWGGGGEIKAGWFMADTPVDICCKYNKY